MEFIGHKRSEMHPYEHHQDVQESRNLQVRDVLQWKMPALSALVLLGGGFCALAGEFILRGDHTVTPLKGESVTVRF